MALSPPCPEQEFQQEDRALQQVLPEDPGGSGPLVGTILFSVLLPSWVLSKLSSSWLLGCESLLPSLPNIPTASLLGSLPT